ncbi:Ig-like domain-containing protein [Photobacterium damselae subsp. piscicida]|nr:Ig-like domain-containing protein [Photobacterium damselae subsp. piscicida]
MTVITEDDGNNEPSLELVLTSPTVGSEFTTGDVVTIAANVTAENTTATQVTFYIDGQRLDKKHKRHTKHYGQQPILVAIKLQQKSVMQMVLLLSKVLLLQLKHKQLHL